MPQKFYQKGVQFFAPQKAESTYSCIYLQDIRQGPKSRAQSVHKSAFSLHTNPRVLIKPLFFLLKKGKNQAKYHPENTSSSSVFLY